MMLRSMALETRDVSSGYGTRLNQLIMDGLALKMGHGMDWMAWNTFGNSVDAL